MKKLKKKEEQIEEEIVELKEEVEQITKPAEHKQPKFKFHEGIFWLSCFENERTRENGSHWKDFLVNLSISVKKDKSIYKSREYKLKDGSEWTEHLFRLKKERISSLKNLLNKAEMSMIG